MASCALHRDLRLRVLQIEARADFLHRLLDGVGHFREIDFADDIETVIGHGMSAKSLDSGMPRNGRTRFYRRFGSVAPNMYT